MPKEKVSSDGSFAVKVGWNRESTVQIGVEVACDHSIVRQLFGSPEMRQRLADEIAKWATGLTSLGGPDDRATTLLNLLDAASDSALPGGYRGLWSTLDRQGCNDLIRTLRRARDQAFGRDE